MSCRAFACVCTCAAASLITRIYKTEQEVPSSALPSQEIKMVTCVVSHDLPPIYVLSNRIPSRHTRPPLLYRRTGLTILKIAAQAHPGALGAQVLCPGTHCPIDGSQVPFCSPCKSGRRSGKLFFLSRF